MLNRDSCNTFISFHMQEADATNIFFLVQFYTGTRKGFILQIRRSVRVQYLRTVSGQLFGVRGRIMTPAGFCPYLEVLHVLGSFMLPDLCKCLSIVESAIFSWQGARTHSLNIIWDTPAHNCESLPRYIVHVQPFHKGVPLASKTKVHEGSDPSCQINGLSPGFSYLCQVSAFTPSGISAPRHPRRGVTGRCGARLCALYCSKSLCIIVHLYHKSGAEMFDQETHCWLKNGRSPDELTTGFTRTIRIFHHDNMEVMFETQLNPPEVTSSALPAPAARTRGSIADSRSATWDLVGDFMTDGGEAAYNFWEVWVDDKLQTNLKLTWYRMGAQYSPRVHLKLKDSVAFSPAEASETVNTAHESSHHRPGCGRTHQFYKKARPH